MIIRCSSAKAPRLTSQKAQLLSDELSSFLMGTLELGTRTFFSSQYKVKLEKIARKDFR